MYVPPEGHEVNVNPDIVVQGEELTFKELAELMIAQGQLTVEEAEEWFGADLDDDDCAYEAPGHQAAAGFNPHALKAEQELKYLASSRMLSLEDLMYDGPITALTKATIAADYEDVQKAPPPPGVAPAYKGKHMTAGGNWKYNYARTTGSGKVAPGSPKRSTAKPGRKDTGTAVSNVSVGGKKYAVLQHTKGDARKLNMLREKGRVDTPEKHGTEKVGNKKEK